MTLKIEDPRTLIAGILAMPDTSILPTYALSDIDTDGTVKHLLAMEVSIRTGVCITDDDMEQCRTVSDVIEMVERKMGEVV